jgi:hypothetical protein
MVHGYLIRLIHRCSKLIRRPRTPSFTDIRLHFHCGSCGVSKLLRGSVCGKTTTTGRCGSRELFRFYLLALSTNQVLVGMLHLVSTFSLVIYNYIKEWKTHRQTRRDELWMVFQIFPLWETRSLTLGFPTIKSGNIWFSKFFLLRTRRLLFETPQKITIMY